MSVKNILLSGVGFVLLAVGAVGAFLPVWPTTPFVLLAIACFSGNPKMRGWVLKNRFINEHYQNYKYRVGLKPNNLAISLSFLWVVLLVSMLLTRALWATVLLLCVGAAVTVHLLYMARPKRRE